MSIIYMIVIMILVLFIGTMTVTWVSKRKKPLKIILLGIEVTVVGGIAAVDQSTNLGGFEYLVVLVGLAFCIVGFVKSESE